jgi:glucokinase
MTFNNKKIAIGVDIGGTNIRAGAVTINGEMVGNSVSVATRAGEDKELITQRIFDVIEEVTEINHFKRPDIKGIGLGVTGPLDVRNGKILQCPSLPTMDFFPLQAVVEDRFGFPVYMNNDANAMMLGEAFWGAGKNFSSILGITLGTGLGCAVIIEKKIWMGSTETAGEIWISPYKNGTIEHVVSGKGISDLYKNRSGKVMSAREISLLAGKGDEDARAVWDEFGSAVAFALSWCVNLIDPEVIIIGGSIVNALHLFLPSLEADFRQQVCPVPAQKVKIAKALLGDNAGFMGAAALVYS